MKSRKNKSKQMETHFHSFIRTISDACIISELPKGKNFDFQNADYLLNNGKIVAELKCLEKDEEVELQKFIDKICEERKILLYGGMPFFKIIENQPDREELGKKGIAVLAKSLKRRLIKANKQLEDTKKKFCLPNAGGLVVMINCNNVSLSPDLAIYALKQLLDPTIRIEGALYKNISAVLYISLTHLFAHKSFNNEDLLPLVFMPRCEQGEFTKYKINKINEKYCLEFQKKWALFDGLDIHFYPELDINDIIYGKYEKSFI